MEAVKSDIWWGVSSVVKQVMEYKPLGYKDPGLSKESWRNKLLPEGLGTGNQD
jgi:hypothetical protein